MKKAKQLTSILAASFLFATTFATVVAVNSSDTSVDSVDGLNLVNEDKSNLVRYANRESATSSTLDNESAYYSIRLGANSGLRYKYVITKDMISAAFSDADVDFSNYTYGVYVAKTSSLGNTSLVDSIENEEIKKLKVEAVNKVISDTDVTFAAVLVGFENEVQFNNEYSAVAYVSNGTTTHYSAESSYSYMKAVEYYLDESNDVYDMLTEEQKTTLTELKTDNAVSYRIVEEGDNLNLYQYSIKNDTNLGEPIATTVKPAVSTATFTVNTKAKGSYTESKTLYEFTNSGNVYTSSNKGKGNSVSSMVVTATSAGTITFEYKVQGEKNWDYLNIYHNGTLLKEKLSDSSSYVTGTETVTVEEGDTLTFAYCKDGSGDSGADSAVITLYDSTYTTSVVSFDTMQGGTINPMIAVRGALTDSIPTPTRNGYYFDGWFTSKTCEEDSRVTDSTSFENDTTLYAHWISNSEANVLMGTHYGFSVSSSTSVTTSYNTLTVDFKGNYEAKYSYSGSSNGTLSSYDETNGTFTTDNGTVHYDQNSNLVVLAHSASHTSSTTYSVYVIGSTSQITTSKVSVATFDSGAYRFISYTDSNDNITNIFIDAVNNEVYFGVVAYGYDGNEVKTSSISSEKVVTVKHNGTTLKVFGCTSSTSSGLVTATDPVGTYSVVGTEDKTVKLFGTGYMIYDGYGSSTIPYTKDSENVYEASAISSYNYTFTFDHEAKTVTVSENKCYVTYDWNGHEDTTVTNTSFVWKDSWLYYPSKPSTDSYVEEDGRYYVFKGWYTDSDLTEKYKQIKLTSDITLYAKWVEGYKVTFDANGGTCSTTDKVVAGGETISLPTVTHKEKMFTNWTLDGEIFEDETSITKNITLVANWEEVPFFVGKYIGYNADHSNVGTESKSSNLSYNVTLGADFSVKGKTTTTWSKDKYDVSTGLLTFTNGAKFYVFESSTGIKVGFAQYSFSSSSEMKWDDYGVYANYVSDDVKPTFDVIYWNNGYNKLFKITVGDKVTYVYSDGENKKIYIDVEFANFEGTAITYSDIYREGALTSELIIKANNTIVAQYKSTGETKYGYQTDDGFAGTYEGTLNGETATVVLDGYGIATVNGDETTYSYDSGIFTVVVDGTTYKFEVNGETLTQILDGKQGAYTGTNGELVLTGWAEGTLDGVDITYTISGNLITITKGEEEINVSLNDDNTYEVVKLSIFAGCTFAGTYYDSWYDCNTSIRIEFAETASITGTLYQGNTNNYYFDFTGELNGSTLVMTITSAVDSAAVGETITATLSGNTLTLTGTTISNGSYQFNNGTLTCADFSA